MILAFTGTRRGTTPAQLLAAFNLIVAESPERFLHGGAVGADEEIDELVAARFWERDTGAERLMMAITAAPLPIGVYPADSLRQAHWLRQDYSAICDVCEPQPPLARNRVMVKLADRLIACPAEQTGEELRSGTWATVRYARAAGKPVTIVRPDGTSKGVTP